ncbi:hypothetical protein EON63_23565, partial [archaeon]
MYGIAYAAVVSMCMCMHPYSYPHSTSQDSVVIGERDPRLTLANPHILSSLVTTTLFFSTEAARYVYAILPSPSPCMAQCMYYQAIRAYTLYAHYVANQYIHQAAECMCMYILLTNTYTMLPSMYAILTSLGMYIHHHTQFIHSLPYTLAGVCAGVGDVYALRDGMCMCMDLYTKYIFTAPHVFHMR